MKGGRSNRPRMLPSVESQTVEFLEHARQRRRWLARQLHWGGIKVYLRYQCNVPMADGQALGEVLVIASVELPERLQRRGWFWRYCQLCCALSRDGIIVESVVSPELLAALGRRPAFQPFGQDSFLLRKKQHADWPFSMLPGAAP